MKKLLLLVFGIREKLIIDLHIQKFYTIWIFCECIQLIFHRKLNYFVQIKSKTSECMRECIRECIRDITF